MFVDKEKEKEFSEKGLHRISDTPTTGSRSRTRFISGSSRASRRNGATSPRRKSRACGLNVENQEEGFAVFWATTLILILKPIPNSYIL